MEERGTSWYDITVAGKRFNIASRHGEIHIREVERLLNETFEQVSARVQGQPVLNIALLTALNLADELLSLRTALNGASEEMSRRVEGLVSRLETVLDLQLAESPAGQPAEPS
jgi:cell division protein ZapA (FtsZ GTPase activity inhibitor)